MNQATAYSARQRYQEMGAEAAITDASPHRLIRLLLQGALDRIVAAKGHMQRGEVAPKCECIGKAIDIVGGLRGALDLERGGEIAANLQAIYDYSELRLLEANLHNDAARLDEVARLLGEIRSAWDTIAPAAGQPAP
ncbi:MAG TPA: flagellar export chaperone FliS [Acidiferrobacterales bacterium]|nr:flagellar export chaperone FliS [Acidiferrobacterales bacterium]